MGWNLFFCLYQLIMVDKLQTDFMLEIWDLPQMKKHYFTDPDIVVVTPGVVLKNVVNCGVAL
jgi:hypothetical protein